MIEESRKGKIIKSAFDSTTFDADVSIYVDRKVGSATISPSGRDVALASTDGLDIIDLDSPLNPPRHLRHGLPWLVADVQWSPFAARDYCIVSTANQKALVWNLNMQEDATHGAIEHTLHGHTRAITDINCSAHHPDILATCAVDGYVHCWDLRRPRTPVITFCDWFAGATQVKFNRQDSHILASSHDRWLRIWDDRKGAIPLRSINAHESKIYGVDWNRTHPTRVVTCSLDKSIKFWDYSNDIDGPERVIRTDFPVWRARHTPFGQGLMAMPQDTPGHLHLYDRRPTDNSDRGSKALTVMTFPGHGDHKVKEFLWRSRGGIAENGVDNRSFQLVSWGEDNHLRLQHVDSHILEGVGYIKGSQMLKKLSLTRKGAIYKTFRTVENTSPEKKSTMIAGPRPGSSGLKVSALSASMKRISVSHNNRGHAIRAPAMKARDKGTKSDEQNQNQIFWMSGIRIVQQDKHPPAQKNLSSRRVSLLNPEFIGDEEWDSPESLHDEIIRIHDRLPKITFEDVNMDKKSIVVSMNGPWGESSNAIFISVTMTFPDQYPEWPPTFSIGKTSLMPGSTYNKIKKEITQIAAGFVSRKQGCLEATLCYLLGEVDLESSTALSKDIHDLEEELDVLANESSSSDEDGDIPAGASAMMSQELDSSAHGDSLAPIHRNANVPLPRLCGARFSMNGNLVCFFPPKDDKVKSLLATLHARTNARSRGEISFETFGRLNNTSPVPTAKTFSLASEMRSESEESDESDTSSSSGSDSPPYRISYFPMSEYFRHSSRRRYARATSTILSQRSSGAGTGTGTGTGITGVSKGRNSKPRSLVSLHKIGDILPSKVELAGEYVIFGNGPDVCTHNANVAERHGFMELADVWRYAVLLLNNEVPLEVLELDFTGESLLAVARTALQRRRSDSGSDSGVDVSFDNRHQRTGFSGRVKWGTHPLASQLISDLFAHYEHLADIQMLAMLSCAFSEPIVIDTISHTEIGTNKVQIPLPMKTPAFSLEYFPSDIHAWSMRRKSPINTAVSTPRTAQTPSGLYGSVGSSNGLWGSDPASASYSCGETPPLRSNRPSLEHLNQYTQSLSTSPEHPRAFRRANSGLASSFAASFARPFSVTASSSPPNPPGRKRQSPVENILNSLAPSGITWGNTIVLGGVKEQTISDVPTFSGDENIKEESRIEVCTGIRITMTNPAAFDDECCMNSPLLNQIKSQLYANYRQAYAELLYSWKQPLARLEMLKFNGLKGEVIEAGMPDKSFTAPIMSNETEMPSREKPLTSPIILGKKEHSQVSNIPQDRVLDVAGYCLKDESRLEPIPSSLGGRAAGRCSRCKTIQHQLRCAICLEPVSAAFQPCLSCGCVTHQHCLLDYHSFGETACPGGCDCDCGKKASFGIVESWEVLMGAMERMRMLEEQRTKREKEKVDDGDWENVKAPGFMPHRTVSVLGKRFDQVRAGDWGISGNRKKHSGSRKDDMH